MEPLKFVALDKDDLDVVSTHLQDAEVKVADILWRAQEKRLVIALDRFDWVAATASSPQFLRRRSALRFERVLRCKCKSVNPASKDDVLNLMAVEFEPTDAPAGAVTLTFAGGRVLRVDVECLEAELVDLGPARACPSRPPHIDHGDDPAAGAGVDASVHPRH